MDNGQLTTEEMFPGFGPAVMPSNHFGNMHGEGKDEWLTPPEIVQALGDFDLDPCSPIDGPWELATRRFTFLDNGLAREWRGRVWMNPPYSTAGDWLAKLAAHGDGIALVFARTETSAWFTSVWPKATAILFLRGRIKFFHINGKRADASAGAPSVLIAYGEANAAKLEAANIDGQFVRLN